MEKSYIDVNELIAEIERLINDKKDDRHVPPADIVAPKRCGYEEILTLVKSFQQEQPDADLEAEVQNVIYDPLYDLDGVAIKGATKYITVEDVADLARYFAEWGAIHPKAIQSLQQEQSEVDVEAEIERWWNKRYAKWLKKDYKFNSMNGHYFDNETIIALVRYFYELGLNVRKKEQK